MAALIFLTVKWQQSLNILRWEDLIFGNLSPAQWLEMTLPCGKGHRVCLAYTEPSCTAGEQNTTGKLWLVTFLVSRLLNTGVTYYYIWSGNRYTLIHINHLYRLTSVIRRRSFSWWKTEHWASNILHVFHINLEEHYAEIKRFSWIYWLHFIIHKTEIKLYWNTGLRLE